MPSSDHPATYKAYAFLEKGGNLQRILFNWQDPDPGEIVVKVIACGVCAGDENAKYSVLPGITYPIVPGHEIVGDVVAIPDTEKRWKLGQRVGAGWHGGHCQHCERCSVADFMTCENGLIHGATRHGGYAEYVTLRTEAVAAIPDGMDPAEAAPLMCAGVTTFHSLRNMSCKPPQLVAVQGIGGLGHLALQFSRKMGYRTVALSSSASKAELSKELGAELYLDGSKVDQGSELQKLGGAALIMCTAPSGEVMTGLMEGLAVNGEVLILAAVPGDTKLPLLAIMHKRASIRGWPAGNPADCEDCCKFALANGVRVMVNKFSLDEAQNAFDHLSSARFRAVIMP
ncbi:chaperonin 10-like protein [Rhodofomes roseus]|uniref:Chaperonin 10-like protein n=1 Tax=Rhodofomes roseus TaxID=34475 RepID=A0ABQ8KPE1_9APHY|nr:chaperonin 10-like protein [Rhodofomes roseus]KAH9840285.1 chaperonin 10-like protein [Rhodofomes roseus]